MNWARQLFNVTAPAPPPRRSNPAVERKLAAAKATPPEESQEVRLQSEVRIREVKLGGIRDEIKELDTDAANLVRLARDPKCPSNKRAQYTSEAKDKLRMAAEKRHLATMKEKELHNLRGQLSVMQTANSNLDHAILLQQGADELESTVAATEALQVEDSVERLQEAAATVHEHSELFTGDMGLSGNPMSGLAQEYEVDEELERLMRDAHDESMDALLAEMHSPPQGATVASGDPRPPSGPPVVAQQPAGAAE